MNGALMAELELLREQGLVSGLDLRFSALMAGLSGLGDPEKLRAFAVLSAMLSRSSTQLKAVRLELASVERDLKQASGLAPFSWAPERLLEILEEAGVAAVSAEAAVSGARAPLVFDVSAGAAYLYKHWLSECKLASAIASRAALSDCAPPGLREFIDRLFSSPAGARCGDPGAAWTVASRNLAIVTGGPGTGKTSSVAAALCALLAFEPSLKIALCAPTGKATAQLRLSVAKQRDILKEAGVDDAIIALLPDEASTLHRLLAWSPSKEAYLRDFSNQLDLDVLLVDEASMMSQAQAAALFDALPEGARLILLGDKDQLASVDAGSVFSDICAKASSSGDAPFLLGGCVAELKKSHRFKEGGGIATLKDAVNNRPDLAWRVLSSGGMPDVELIQISSETPAGRRRELRDALSMILSRPSAPGGELFGSYRAKLDSPEAAFRVFDSFRAVCSNRNGDFGAEGVNALTALLLGIPPGAPGAPVMVLKNDYNVRLFNGDVGLLLPHGGGLRACFPNNDYGAPGSDEPFSFCPLPLLPEHEPAFAMTVHKAQGAGYDTVAVVLSPEEDSPVLTRELVYTAITRAKSKVYVISARKPFEAAVRRKTERPSGLPEALRAFLSGRA